MSLTVEVRTVADTATGGGTDYTDLPLQTLTFGLSESFKDVTVDVTADDVDEADESFVFELSSPSDGATLSPPSGALSITIIDDDNPTLAIDDVSVDEAAGTAVFTVTQTGATTFAVSVQFATSNNGATAPDDYAATSGTLSFDGADGETQEIAVPIVDDDLQESAEMFRVILSNALGADITDNVGDGTITDNDVPAISINDVTVSEGAGSATFTVSTGVRLQSPLTIDFDTSDGGVLPDSAIAPADYTAIVNGAVVVAAGSNQTNLNVVIQDDDVAEPSEDFTVTLSGGGGVDLVDAVGVATILDDDVADLSLTKAASPTLVAPGEDITYTIIVSNAGPGDADNVVVEDILAADLELVSATVLPDTPCGDSAGTISCDLGTIANGADATVVLIVRAVAPGSFENTATATSDLLDTDGAAGSAPAVFVQEPIIPTIPTLDARQLLLFILLLGAAAATVIRTSRPS